MAFEAHLLMGSEAPREILAVELRFLRTENDHKDGMIYHELITKGIVTPKLQAHLEITRSKTPSGTILGPLIHLKIKSQMHDRYFYDWLKSDSPRHGEVMVFRWDDEYMPMKRIKFWDGYLANAEGRIHADPNLPFTLDLFISAAVIDINGMVYKNTWHETDPERDRINPFAPGFQKEDPSVNKRVEEIETEVAVISLLDKPDYTPDSKSEVILFDKDYRIKVDSYTTRERYTSETVKWQWGYMGSSDNGSPVFIELGNKTGGDLLTFKITDLKAEGKELLVYAWIHDKAAGGYYQSQIDPFYYYKGVREWGRFQDDLARQNKRIPVEELKTRLGEKKFNKRVQPYLFKPQADADYQYALKHVLSKSVAEDVIRNFYYGNGKKLSYGPDTKIAKDLKKHPDFQTYFKTYLDFLKEFIPQKKLANINDVRFEEELKLIDFSNKSEIIRYNFYGLMGGTQKTKVEFEVQQISKNQYEVKTTMYIKDWYGADWDDINSDRGIKSIRDAGLWAFFMLQHYHGCTPFESELVYESVDIITL